GSRLRRSLEELGVTTEGLVVQPGYRTPTKTRILGGERSSVRQQVARYDIESQATIGDEERRHFRRCLEEWKGRASVAVLSDYGYGAVLPELAGELRAALGEPRTVLCDSRYRLKDFAGMDGATPNQEEVEALLGEPLDEPGRVTDGGQRLRDRLEADFLLMTRGSQGMALFDGDAVTHIPVHGTGQVADVTGAGDTVIGTFALARAAGATALEAAFIANYAAGVVVHKPGTAVPTLEELRRAVETDPAPLEEARTEPY
ncbi:MAG: PfkB family carbohydrate kinase, partial [Thermoanaerobaculia bacterium]|nr:PfkB family carbohydrate kinase [Thermoanaerobaculia bacterium]